MKIKRASLAFIHFLKRKDDIKEDLYWARIAESRLETFDINDAIRHEDAWNDNIEEK